MSSRGLASVISSIIVGALIIAAVGATYYLTSSQVSSISAQNTNLKGQVGSLGDQLSGLNQQIASQDQQIGSLNQQDSNLNQQLSNANGQISSLSQQISTQTVKVVTETDTVNNIVTTTFVTTTTLTSITEVPMSTLVVLSDTYSNATKTFTFQVQNTENYTVHAQLSASLWGQTSFGCNGQIGSYISQVYTFGPNSETTTILNLTLGQYVGFCGTNPTTSLQMNLVIPQSTAISPTYSFNIVPGYDHS
jgi:predicted PurR-regulated permease PerM